MFIIILWWLIQKRIEFKYRSSELFDFVSSLLSFFLVFGSSGILLGFEFFSLYFFGFFLENSFDQDSFVFELISFSSKVKSVIESSVDFFRSSIFSKESSEDSLSSDPKDFSGHSCLSCSSLFTGSTVSAQSFGLQMKSSSWSWMNVLLSLHDKTVFNKLSDEYSGVSLTNLFDFVRIDPNSFLSALEDFRCESLLTFQTDHKFKIII